MTRRPPRPSPVLPRRALNRRTLMGLGLGVPTATLLAACTSFDEQDGAAGTPANDSEAEKAWQPVTVEHRYGTTSIEDQPTRVVGAGLTEQDFMLALGVVPLAVTDWYGDQPYGTWPWAQDELGSAEPTLLNTTDGFQFTRVGSLSPDLILGLNAGLTEKDYDEFSKIAPTVAQPPGEANFFPGWRAMLALMGDALGRGTEAERVEQEIDDLFTQASADHPELTGNAIFLQNAAYDGNLIAYQEGLSTDFLTDLGFTVPDNLDQYVGDDGGQAYIPLERIEELNAADWLIWATEKDSDQAALEKLPGFDRLEAVRAGRSVYTGGELAGAIYFTSPLSLPYVVDKLVPLLTEAV